MEPADEAPRAYIPFLPAVKSGQPRHAMHGLTAAHVHGNGFKPMSYVCKDNKYFVHGNDFPSFSRHYGTQDNIS